MCRAHVYLPSSEWFGGCSVERRGWRRWHPAAAEADGARKDSWSRRTNWRLLGALSTVRADRSRRSLFIQHAKQCQVTRARVSSAVWMLWMYTCDWFEKLSIISKFAFWVTRPSLEIRRPLDKYWPCVEVEPELHRWETIAMTTEPCMLLYVCYNVIN